MTGHDDRLTKEYSKARRGKSQAVKAMVEYAGAEVRRLPEGIRGREVDFVIIDDDMPTEKDPQND